MRRGSPPAALSFPGLQALCSLAPKSPNTPRLTWRVLLILPHLKGLLGNTERARIMPRHTGILSMGREVLGEGWDALTVREKRR